MTMTDGPDFSDEAISRYLDGEATEAEIALIESDPARLARVEQMRTAIDMVASPVPVPTTELDRIRAVALAESATSGQVTDLAAAAARRDQRRTRFLAVAAAFVMLAIGVTAIRSQDRTVDTASVDDAATTTTDDSADDGDMEVFAEADMADEAGVADTIEEDMAESALVEPSSGADAAFDADATADDGAADAEAAADLRLEVLDRLPDELPPVSDLDELRTLVLDVVAMADGKEQEDDASPEGVAPVCDPVVEFVDVRLPAGLAFIEIASVEIDGEARRLALATGVDKTLVAVVFDDGCQDLVDVGIDEG